MINRKQVVIRCDDCIEALVFTKYLDGDFGPEYEFSIKDCYLGYNYKGFIGRLKRAWHAFIAQPLVYNTVYIENPERVESFLESCLKIIKYKKSENITIK